MKTVKFAVVTVTLIFITAFSVTGTVLSQNKNMDIVDAKSRREIENRYIAGIRTELGNQGYKNAGITMTRITDADKAKEYKVLIYHRSLKRLAAKEKQMLINDLRKISFPLENCCFAFEFLEYESGL